MFVHKLTPSVVKLNLKPCVSRWEYVFKRFKYDKKEAVKLYIC